MQKENFEMQILFWNINSYVANDKNSFKLRQK